MKKLLNKLYKIWPLLLLLTLYFLLVAKIYKNYGISIYEESTYKQGKYLTDYLLKHTNDLANDSRSEDFINPIQNTVYNGYTALLYNINKNIDFGRGHLINFITASILLIVSYFVFLYKTKHKYISVIGPIFILAIPRFFGQIPFDSRGVPFSIFYVLSVLAIYLLNHTQNKLFNDVLIKSLILGFLFGVTQSLCPLGYSIYIIFIMYNVHHLKFKYEDSSKQTKIRFVLLSLKTLVITALIANMFMILTWPFIGNNFLNNSFDVIKEFFTSTAQTGFNSFFINNQKNSLLTLIKFNFLTTPIIFLLLGVLNIGFIKEKLKDDLYFLFLCTFILNFLISSFVKSSVLIVSSYFIFLQIILALISAEMALYILFEEKNFRLKLIFSLLIVTGVFAVIGEMIILHPYEYIYFNESAGGIKKASTSYNLDYLQTNYNQAASWIKNDIKATNPSEPKVFFCSDYIDPNYYSENIYKSTKDITKADYISCPLNSSNIEPVYIIERNGVLLNTVSKINNGQ